MATASPDREERSVRQMPKATYFVVAALSLALPELGFGISIRHDVPPQQYFDLAASFPAAGRLDLSGFGAWCSASLVAPDKVLTAAHCTSGISAASFTFRLGDNLSSPVYSRSLSALSINPNYTGNELGDLSVLTLSSPITDVEPMQISSLPPVDEVGTFVGFGDNGNGQSFNGAFDNRKRAAQNLISVANASTLRSDFDNPAGTTSTYNPTTPLPLEGTTASGDSGGPITVDFGFGEVIVGVLHGGFNNFGPDSRYGDISIWTPINRPANINYLQSQGLAVVVQFVPSGDFNADGEYNCDDINLLTSAIANNNDDTVFDLDGNGSVGLEDRDLWLVEAGAANLDSGNPYPLGDVNLDGIVDGQDFLAWNAHKFSSSSLWCHGDLNADGSVDGSDFLVWNTHKFQSADPRVDAYQPGNLRPFSVPEPTGVWGLALLAMGTRIRRTV